MIGTLHMRSVILRLTKVIVATLMVACLLCSCSSKWFVGDGRGDWKMDIYGQYYIFKTSSRRIVFTRKYDDPNLGYMCVIPNYFVTAYQLHEPYIYLEGIQTEELFISEDELRANILSYYIFDTTNEETTGPFESKDDFEMQCTALGLDPQIEWIKIDRKRSKPPA